MRRVLTCFALLTAAGCASRAAAETRTVSVAVTDEKGQPLGDLRPDDVAVVENGSARDLLGLRRDERPLNVLLLVDTSEELRSSLRLNLIDALDAFLKALPAGARFAVWRTGERPTKVVALGNDRVAATSALKRLFPQGGNTLLDALVEATREFKTQEGEQRAVVAVSGMTTEFSNRPRQQVVDQARPNADTFSFLQIEEGNANDEARTAYGYVFEELSRRSGGRFETSLTSMAAQKPLLAIASDLQHRYLISYESDAKKPGKLEVHVARPNTRVRVAEPEEPKEPKK